MGKLLLTPLVVRDRQYTFREDPIPEAAGNADLQPPLLEKLSCFIDVLQLSGSYELAHRLWVGFTLTAGRINVTVAWF